MTKSHLSKQLMIEGRISGANNGSTRVLVPSLIFQAKSNEKMALTLLSFTAANVLYTIHNYNSIFYLVYNATHYEIRIAMGYYESNTSLVTAVQTAIQTTITNNNLSNLTAPTVTQGSVTGKLIITVTNSDATNAVSFRTYHAKSGIIPPGVSYVGFTSDTWQILGGHPMTSPTDTPSFISNTANTSEGRMPTTLNSTPELYLRLNVGTNSFSSTGYDRNLRENERLVESHIFAVLPRDSDPKILHYTDSSDAFQSFLSQSTLDVLELRLTDAHNRGLHELMPELTDNYRFQVALRWDLFMTPQPNVFYQKGENLLHNHKRPLLPDRGLI